MRIVHMGMMVLAAQMALLPASGEEEFPDEDRVRIYDPGVEGPKPGEAWWLRDGQGEPLCEAIAAALKPYTHKELGECIAAVPLGLPGMRELDGWGELDPRRHKALFLSLVQYRRVGPYAYFGKPGYTEYFEQKKQDEQTLERFYRTFLEVGGRMRTVKAQVFRVSDEGVVYENPQTLVELRHPQWSSICLRAPDIIDWVETFYVTADLTGPDPGVGPGVAFISANGRVVEYQGVPHLITGSLSLGVYRSASNGKLWTLCSIGRNYPQPND